MLYVLSFGTEISDLGWPCTALRMAYTPLRYTRVFRSPPHKV